MEYVRGIYTDLERLREMKETADMRVTAKVAYTDGYLTVTINNSGVRKWLRNKCDATDSDLATIRFWGSDRIREIQNAIGLSTSERLAIRRGRQVGKYIARPLVESWVEDRRRKRLRKQSIIARIDEVLSAIHKLFLKDQRLRKKAHDIAASDIIPCMDGSTLLWLSVILSAKKDFLQFHDQPNKNEIEDYLTAQGFLFSDDYTISLDSPDAQDGKCVNLRDLLDFCIENCSGRRLNAGLVDPSVEHLRSSLARLSGDEMLISKYCTPDDRPVDDCSSTEDQETREEIEENDEDDEF